MTQPDSNNSGVDLDGLLQSYEAEIGRLNGVILRNQAVAKAEQERLQGIIQELANDRAKQAEDDADPDEDEDDLPEVPRAVTLPRKRANRKAT